MQYTTLRPRRGCAMTLRDSRNCYNVDAGEGKFATLSATSEL
jgi:hypothetical protein